MSAHRHMILCALAGLLFGGPWAAQLMAETPDGETVGQAFLPAAWQTGMSAPPLSSGAERPFAGSMPSQVEQPPAQMATYNAEPDLGASGKSGAIATQFYDGDSSFGGLAADEEAWSWQILPAGILYKSYMAGGREPRLSAQLVHERDAGWLLDATLGGRVGLLRYGTEKACLPQGWQLDIEGAAFPRLDNGRNVVETEFRAGMPLTVRSGPWESKLAYYHYCSHIGDLYLLANPGYERINYVRDAFVWGIGVYPLPSVRLYSEAGWAFHTDGGAEPWEFQFGAEFVEPGPTDIHGSPFFAVNGHLRQETDFGGSMTLQTGWQWRGTTGHQLRLGMQYFNGMSDQGQFFNRFEEQIGMGVWYDF